MKAKLLVAMTGAAALLIGAALPPVANAQEDCDTATADLAETNKVAARDSLLSARIDPAVSATISTDQEFADETYRMVCRAENWQTDGLARGGDLNPVYSGGSLQPMINHQDAAIMYYVMTFIDTIGGSSVEARNLRDNLIGDFAGTDTSGVFLETDGDFLELVERTVTLLCQTDPAGEAGAYADHALCNSGG